MILKSFLFLLALVPFAKASSLTIYSGDHSLVKEKREIGSFVSKDEFLIDSICSGAVAGSFRVLPAGKSGDPEIKSLRFIEAFANYNDIMDSFVGDTVKLLRYNEKNGTEIMKKALLIKSGPGPVFSIDGEVYLGAPGNVVLPSLPVNRGFLPGVLCSFDGKLKKKDSILISYMTSGLGWKADYSIYAEKKGRGIIESWVSIENRTGRPFNNTEVKIMAGEVNFDKGGPVRPVAGRNLFARAESGIPRNDGAQQKPFSGFHIFSLPEPVDLLPGSPVRVRLFPNMNLSMERVTESVGGPCGFSGREKEEWVLQDIFNYLEFSNDKKSGVGKPLPSGTVRVYRRNGQEYEFAGEDNIENIPVDEKVKVRLGKAFDLKVKRKQSLFERKGRNVSIYGCKFSVVNSGGKKESIRVMERMSGEWDILENSLSYNKLNSGMIAFDLNLKPEEEKEFFYKVRVER
ncbi:MAG: DUF4139 domain-containing protein [Fibrobacterota bacterium]